MKYKSCCFIVLCFLISCIESKKNKGHSLTNYKLDIALDSSFKHHFKILDSVSKKNAPDTVFACCSASISFMEANTGIEGHADGTLLGKLFFSKRDLERWHRKYSELAAKK